MACAEHPAGTIVDMQVIKYLISDYAKLQHQQRYCNKNQKQNFLQKHAEKYCRAYPGRPRRFFILSPCWL
jgi:hypothetical protein